MAVTTLGQAFRGRELRDPGIYRLLFSNTLLAPAWTLARMYIGYQWLLAGSHKVWGGQRWINVPGPDGLPLQAFWQHAVSLPQQGAPPIAFDWYRRFLSFMLDHGWYHWFAWVIGITETTVGVLLIVGAFTGLAALTGAFLNFNFLLAGSASTNPVMFIIAILVAFAWKTAGWIGLDRWLLPALGTPWEPGPLFRAPPRADRGPREAGYRPGTEPV